MGVFIPILSALFIGLKLAEIIDWSWWWVLSPIWISTALSLLLAMLLYGASQLEKVRF